MIRWILYVSIICLGAAALICYLRDRQAKGLNQFGSHLMSRRLFANGFESHMRLAAERDVGKRPRRLKYLKFYQSRLAALCKRLNSVDDNELLPALRWIRDNGRVIEEEWLTVRQEIKALPPLPTSSNRELSVLRFSKALVSYCAGEITGEMFIRGLLSWGQTSPMGHQELWASPVVLRWVLLRFILCRGEQLWQNQRLRSKGIRLGKTLIKHQSRLSRQNLVHPSGGCTFWEAAISVVHASDNPLAHEHLSKLLAQLCISDADRLSQLEHRKQTEDQLWIGNCITSLKRLAKVNWTKMLEALDPMDAQLRKDPVYEKMDAPSRGYYRACAVRLSSLTGQSEQVIVERAVQLALQGEADGVHDHVGYYLTEWEGVQRLIFGVKPKRFRWRLYAFYQQHRFAIYRAFLIFGVLASALASLSLRLPLILIPAIAALFSQATRYLIIKITSRLVPHRILPKIQVDRLTENSRTLVVCPTLLTDSDHALQMVKKLALLYHGHPDANLHFMLLGDLCDAPTQERLADKEIIAAASAAVNALNETLPGRFFYYQRSRTYHSRQKAYIPRERKRGALESINLLLTGQTPKDEYCFMSAPAQELAHAYAYVITLDCDTLLPPGTAYQLIGAMMHPLQKRRLLNGQWRGVSVIAPRCSTLMSQVGSKLSALWGGWGGIDPYNASLSDLYQDVWGRGSYFGKGIYDPAAFLASTEPFIPPDTVLSHDLLEGEMAGCALSSDIVLYDGHPSTLSGWMKRLHRWTRGDWQLIGWLLPRHGQRLRFHPDALSRHKLWDNLRRSLLPLCQCALLFYSVCARHDWLLWLTFLLSVLPFSSGRLIEFAFLPYRLFIQTDAAFRSLWRLFVSRQHLLDWTPSHLELNNRTSEIPAGVWWQWLIGGCFLAVSTLIHPLCWFGISLGALFIFSPFMINALEKTPFPVESLDGEQKNHLRRLAASTWQYFEETVTAEDNYLPPDNRQVDPPVGIAHRTSPTNIGFYLLSLTASQALGLIDSNEMAAAISKTVETLERLSKWKGHLYNWYDTRTLRVLEPAYVSSVDSGNLCACMLACAQSLRSLAPELEKKHWDLSARLDSLALHMELGALFDPEAELFYIGYNADTDAYTNAHYDLMASEARLVSYISVMTGQVPMNHWFRLGRPMTKIRRNVSMFSWSGTMFEYLMPHILLPLIPRSLLHTSCLSAVRVQMRQLFQKTWGVSESAYYAFDPQLNYQYKAFGLPELALGSSLGHRAIAPYAAALACPLCPRKAADNLIRMLEKGWGCECGLYESIDYDPSRMKQGEKCLLIKCQMAHHQGMLLCSLANLLTGDRLSHYFMALPSAKAYQPLLEEPMPKGIIKRKVPFASIPQPAVPIKQSFERIIRHITLPPEGQLIHGNQSTLFVDHLGNGFMKQGEKMITRFTGTAGQKEGFQLYLKDVETDTLWQPTDPLLEGRTRFSAGCAEFQRKSGSFQTSFTCWINPIDGAFLHRIEIENLSGRERCVEAASYIPITLIEQEADLAHPAFRELFVETASLNEHTLIARRRQRDVRDSSATLTHTFCCDTPFLASQQQTDRCAFIGRNGSVHAPAWLKETMTESSSILTGPIHPCMSLRAQFMIPPKAKVTLLYATWWGNESVLSPLGVEERYHHPRSAQPLFRLAETQSLAAARYAGIGGDQYGLLSRICSLLIYGSTVRHDMSRLGNDGCWRLGISGSHPIWLVYLNSSEKTAFVDQCLSLHRLLTLLGLPIDLLFIGSEASVEILETFTAAHERDRIKWFVLNDVDDDTHRTLRNASRLILSDNGGALAEQISGYFTSWSPPEDLAVHPSPAGRLEPLSTGFNNGMGGFMMNETGYVIDLVDGNSTPAPWCQLLALPQFGTLVCETGILFSWQGNSHHRRLSPWINNPVTPHGSEGFVLYDEEMKSACSPTPFPLGGGINYRVTYSPGSAEYTALGFGLQQHLTIWTDPIFPLSIRRWKIQNNEHRRRHLRLSHFVHFMLGSNREDCRHVNIFEQDGMLCATSPDFEGLAVFGMLQERGILHTMTESELKGFTCHPLSGLTKEEIASTPGPVAVISHTIELKPSQSCQVVFVLGTAASWDDWLAQISLLQAQGVSARMRLLQTYWSDQLTALQFHLPQQDLQVMMNGWLPYQVRASRLCARAGFYQAGGAIGFRDQLQDMLSLIHTHPDRVRAHLIDCAAHQFEEGDVQHWWHPPRLGVRTRISDDLLFLPYVTAWYIRATEDIGILDEQVPYLVSPLLAPVQEDRYESPALSEYQESLRQHCLKALKYVELGEHGLPLMKGGDWNDGMNRIGGEKGESVWLGFFYATVLRDFASYAQQEEENLLRLARQLLENLDQYGWDGQWYLRAYKDSGEPVGSARSSACQIDNLSQSWAVLAGMPKERCETAMEAAYQRLFDPQLGIMKLLEPPFDPADDAGYIGGYLPGIRENGGQYTHAVPWFIWAMTELGWIDRAWQMALAILPINHTLTQEGIERYRVEPYVMAGDVYTHPQQKGRGGWTFYTGSAGWLYTVVLEKLLGFERHGSMIRLVPRVPETWNSFAITYQWGSSTYHLTASRSETPSLDGQPLQEGWATLIDDGKIHQATFSIP